MRVLLRREHMAMVLVLAAAACQESTGTLTRTACGEGLRFYAQGDTSLFAFDPLLSQQQLPGRTRPLRARRYAYPGFGLIQWVANDSTADFCSLDTTVIGIRGDSLIARSAGTTRLFARNPSGLGDSITIQVLAAGWTATALNGDTGIASAMNDSGHATVRVGSSGFLWRNGTVTSLDSCVPLDLNNRDEVLCGNGPIWRDAGVQTLALPGSVSRVIALNDSGTALGEASFSGGAGCGTNRCGFRIYSSGSVDYFSASSPYLIILLDMNVNGDVSGYELGFGGYDSYPFVVVGTTRMNVPSSGGPAGITDQLDLLGSFRVNRYQSRPAVWRHAGGSWTLVLLRPRLPGAMIVNGYARRTNARGDIVGDGAGRGLFWPLGEMFVSLTDVVANPDLEITQAVGIDAVGRILAQGKSTSTGKSTAYLLTPP